MKRKGYGLCEMKKRRREKKKPNRQKFVYYDGALTRFISGSCVLAPLLLIRVSDDSFSTLFFFIFFFSGSVGKFVCIVNRNLAGKEEENYMKDCCVSWGLWL